MFNYRGVYYYRGLGGLAVEGEEEEEEEGGDWFIVWVVTGDPA